MSEADITETVVGEAVVNEPEVEATETTRTSRLSLRTALIGGTLLLIAGGVALRAMAPEPIPVAVANDAGIPVETLTLAPSALEHRVRVSGIVEAKRDVALFAEQMGRVREVGAEALDWVTADQLLMRIDTLPGEAEVAQAEAVLAQRKSQLDLARSEHERFRALVTSRVSSASDLERKQNDERVAVAEHLAAEASLRAARDRLSQRTLLAPFDGVLRVFDAEVGEYVSPGQHIGELLDVSQVRVTVGLRDLDVVAVKPGMNATVRIDALPGQTFPGTVLRVARAADPTSRKFPVQVQIDNAHGDLMPGMVAVVDLDLKPDQNVGSVGEDQVLLVPDDAVLDEFGLRFVYVIESAIEDDIANTENSAIEGEVAASAGGAPVARRRRIEARTVPFQPGILEVTAGLRTGDRIATTSLRQLRDGSRVEPRHQTAMRSVPTASTARNEPPTP